MCRSEKEQRPRPGYVNVRAAVTAALLLGVTAMPGCVIVQTGVTNPIPGMTTVAVAPFINLSAERAVDGRRFALAYHAELQKVPGYQVIPVGVTEQAIVDLGLDLDGPEDALRLAQALGADAVVIGAVTDYTPYYPPRIGLQVSWYAPEPWRFSPGLPTDPQLGEAVRLWRFARTEHFGPRDRGRFSSEASIVRAQSPDGSGPLLIPPSATVPEIATPPALRPQPVAGTGELSAVSGEVVAAAVCPPQGLTPGMDCPPESGATAVLPAGPHDPHKPIMAYTRLFDGSDAELTALLRDYVTLSGDLRSGGWEAYLHRTEDFIRFASHRMIVEMLTLHGGESKRRYVWMLPHERH